ncbi:Protein kinase domain [Trypanosoma vivax]|nr:Protein kinase domain [Trypanosoma vivax]
MSGSVTVTDREGRRNGILQSPASPRSSNTERGTQSWSSCVRCRSLQAVEPVAATADVECHWSCSESPGEKSTKMVPDPSLTQCAHATVPPLNSDEAALCGKQWRPAADYEGKRSSSVLLPVPLDHARSRPFAPRSLEASCALRSRATGVMVSQASAPHLSVDEAHALLHQRLSKWAKFKMFQSHFGRVVEGHAATGCAPPTSCQLLSHAATEHGGNSKNHRIFFTILHTVGQLILRHSVMVVFVQLAILLILYVLSCREPLRQLFQSPKVSSSDPSKLASFCSSGMAVEQGGYVHHLGAVVQMFPLSTTSEMALLIVLVGSTLAWVYFCASYRRNVGFAASVVGTLARMEKLSTEQLLLASEITGQKFCCKNCDVSKKDTHLVIKVISLSVMLEKLGKRSTVVHTGEGSKALATVPDGRNTCDFHLCDRGGPAALAFGTHLAHSANQLPPCSGFNVVQVPPGKPTVSTTCSPSAVLSPTVCEPEVGVCTSAVDEAHELETEELSLTSHPLYKTAELVSPLHEQSSTYFSYSSTLAHFNKIPSSESSLAHSNSESGEQQIGHSLLKSLYTEEENLSDCGFLTQPITFLVCRLFLPLVELADDELCTHERLKYTQLMSKRFLEVVLRVAKEEHVAVFNVRMDSVIVTFHELSGANSVNLVGPRNCAFHMVSELQKLELEFQHSVPTGSTSSPFAWGVVMHLSHLLVDMSLTTAGHTPSLCGSDVKLAHRVTELCRTLNSPLLILQPCYDVFRVCMSAVPVDMIYRHSYEGKVRTLVYDVKAAGSNENAVSSHNVYGPMMLAFALMCEKKFGDAARCVESVIDVDSSALRLHRLCQYFAQLEEGNLRMLLSGKPTYVRDGPKWRCVEGEACNFLRKAHASNTSLGRLQSSHSMEDMNDLGILNDGTHETRTLRSHSRICSATDVAPTECWKETPLPLNPSCASLTHGTSDIESKCSTLVNVGSIDTEHAGRLSICVRRRQRSAAICSVGSQSLNDEWNRHSPFGDRVVNFTRLLEERHGEKVCGKMEFDIFEPIEASPSSTVYRGLHPDGNVVAIAEYPLPSMDEMSPQVQSLFSEIELLSCCHHKNIVRYIGSCFQDGFFYTISEFVSGGSLAALVQTFHGLQPDVIRRYAGDILRGLQYLHDRNIVHRNISPNNVLVGIDGNCKVSDFCGAVECVVQKNSICISDDGAGSSEDLPESDSIAFQCPPMGCSDAALPAAAVAHNVVGNPMCFSPEACREIIDAKNDIWAFGITLCFCLSGSYPWPKEVLKDMTSFTNKVASGTLTPTPPFELMDTYLADFVNLCLRGRACDRPSAAELLYHPFIVS